MSISAVYDQRLIRAIIHKLSGRCVVQAISSKDKQRNERRYIKSSSFVMAVFFTVMCGLAALCLGYFINFFTTGHFIHSNEAVLSARMELVQSVGRIDEGVDGAYLQLLLNDHTLPEGVVPSNKRYSEGILVFNYDPNGKRYAARILSLEDGRKILVGFDITEISRDFRRMQYMGVISIIFVMIVVFVSYLISVFVVSGTNKIATTAHEIMQTGDLSRRLEFSSRWDDLSNMAVVLNGMLDRIEHLMIGIRRVSDNVAHDLRTPLTRMKNQIETLNDKYGDEEHALLLQEADHLLVTFTAILRISRIETEKQRSHFKPLDLSSLLQDVAAFYEPLAEDKQITLDVNVTGAPLTGDRDLLFQAYANILDNAVKFTPAGGGIRIDMAIDKGRTKIEVFNTGRGTQDHETEKIFDRFYRGELSRTSSGTGLGLSLVKAVIELHEGEVSAENTAEGFRIITIL
ncbi:MAG TPA: hypothetical protein EYG18_08895 [Micavibrio sp.]|nr:hypothetical protein [Micavibrio sp.]